MQDFQTWQTTVATIRKRVAAVIGNWVNDTEAIQAVVACACREPLPILGVLFTRAVTLELTPRIASLAITDEEWGVLFGATATQPHRAKELAEIIASSMFKKEAAKLEAALLCTLSETTPRQAWTRAITKVATYVGLHFVSCEEVLSAALGAPVRADARRIDELVSEFETRGCETMEVANMIVSLSNAACLHH